MQAQPDPPSAISALWHFRKLSAAIIGSLVLLGALAALVLPTSAAATSTVLLTDPRAGLLFRQAGTSSGDLVRNTADQAELMESSLVLSVAAERLDPPATLSELQKSVTALPAPEANIVRVTATDDRPDRAVDVTNAVVDAYRQIRQEDSDQRLADVLDEIDAARQSLPLPGPQAGSQDAYLQSLVGLNAQETEARLSSAIYNDGVEAIDPAVDASGGRVAVLFRNTALAVLGGGLIALLVAWRRAEEHARVEDADDLRKLVGVPVLGTSTWPKRRKLTVADLRDEAHEAIVARLRLSFTSGVVMVTGPDAEAVGLLALSVAVGIADERRNCALIDADTHASHAVTWAHNLASLELPAEEVRERGDGPDLSFAMQRLGSGSAVARGFRAREGDVLFTLRTVVMDATRVPIVSLRDEEGDVAARLRSPSTERMIEVLRATADVIVVSAPGLPDEPEAISMVTRADGVVLAINAGAPLAKVRELEERVLQMPSKLHGVVLVAGRPPLDGDRA